MVIRVSNTGRRSGLGIILGLLLLVGVVAVGLTLLNSTTAVQQTMFVREVRPGTKCAEPGDHYGRGKEWPEVTIRSGLKFREPHAFGHRGQELDAERLYKILLEHRCVWATKYCNPAQDKELYLCVDPVGGLLGGLFVVGDEIIDSGWGSKESYWRRVVEREGWEMCK